MQNDKQQFKKDFTKRLVKFSLDTIRLAHRLSKTQAIMIITNQLIRSVTSVGANVIEAKGSGSRKDYLKSFEIALKSANESQYWFILIREICPKEKEEIKRLLEECKEISRILASSILTMKGRK